jgi:phosphoglycerate dehydrogenase-like enzyme
MPTVLITPEAMLHRPAPYVDMLREAGFDIRYPENPHFTRGLGTEAETIDQLRGAAAVVAGGEFFTENVMLALPELRVIARSGVGYDRVDVEAASRRGIAVTITPTANHEAVAEFTLALMFAVAKQIVVCDGHARAGRWPRAPMQPIRGKTLGIVGLGRIGRSTAIRAKALGMTVLATEKFPNEEFVLAQGMPR